MVKLGRTVDEIIFSAADVLAVAEWTFKKKGELGNTDMPWFGESPERVTPMYRTYGGAVRHAWKIQFGEDLEME